MEIVIQELLDLKEKYQQNELKQLIREIDFVVYGVHSHERVKTVCELLMQRPCNNVQNFQADDEIISVLTIDENEPALIICEGSSPNAGITRIVSNYGPRVFSLGFEVKEIERVRKILAARNVQFTDEIKERKGVKYFSTTQSSVTCDSVIYVERTSKGRSFDFMYNDDSIEIEREIVEALKKKKQLRAFTLMHELDHIAYRVHHTDILAVADEIMKITPYVFSEAHEIEEHNAKTIVFRFGDKKPAVVASYGRNDKSLVEQYVKKYGPRIHHIAYQVENIFEVVSLQKKQKITFTSNDVIGMKEEGIVQIFTTPSPTTNEITEYIQRFDGFTGFFSDKNVGNLMTSTRAFQ